jgi:nucleotide-binding universal stress UspA family protein
MKILFGDDGSMSADAAWLWVNSHEWPGWDIDVLRAVSDSSPPEVRPSRELLRPDVAARVHEDVVEEDPRFALHTRGKDYDLLVVGSKGRGLLKALHIGSTAEWLIDMPTAPTVIVRGGHGTRRILLAHDGSRHAMAAERAILTLPWVSTVQVRVLSISDGTSNADEVTEQARQRLQGHVAAVDVAVVGPDDLEVFYRPRDVILRHITDWQPDLVAIGSRGMTRWESLNEAALFRAGSTATGVANHATCSVLVARHTD